MFTAGNRLTNHAKHWLVGCPLFLPLLVGVFSLLALSMQSYWIGCLSLILWLLGFCLNRTILILSILFSFCLMGLHYRIEKNGERVEKIAEKRQRVEIKGVVTKVLHHGGCFVKTTQIDGNEIRAKVYLRFADEVRIGDVLQGEFRIRRPMKPRNLGEFDEAGWLESVGAVAVIRGDFSVLGYSNMKRPLRWLADLREGVKTRLSDGVAESNSVKVIHSMFLGERYGNKDQIILDYRHSGAMHVFAVSGLHVMMVGTIVMLMCRLCQFGRWVAIPLVIVVMTCYAGVTGWGTPAVRALVMAIVVLVGYLVRRKPRLVNNVSASAMIVLLIDPHQLFSPGFQLSYGVVFTIILLAGWWSDRLQWIYYVEPFLPRSLYTKCQIFWFVLRKRLAEGLAVSFAAWIGSSPLIAYYFKMFSPVGLLIGVPMVVTLYGVMCLSCLSLLLGSFHSSLSRPVNVLNGMVAGVSYDLANQAASLKGGHYLYQETLKEKLVVLDVKRGGSIYMGMGGGVLLDAGGSEEVRSVLKMLDHYEAPLDSCILSHGDGGHSAGLLEVLERYEIRQLMVPDLHFRSRASVEVLSLAKEQGVKRVVSTVGASYQLGDETFLEVLYNGSEIGAAGADDRGLVLRLNWKGFKFLMMNDAGFYVEKKLLESGVDLSSDVLIVGKNQLEEFYHHDFYEAVKARVIVATDYQYDYRELRSKHWEKSIKATGATLLYQSTSGAVVMSLKKGKLEFETKLSGKKYSLSRD